MFKHRLQSGLLMGAALLAAIFFLPSPGVPVVLLVVVGIAMLEFYALLRAGGVPTFRYLGLLGGLALIASTWFSLRGASEKPFDAESVILFLITAGVFLRQFPQKDNPRPLVTISSTLLGVMYVAFLFNFFTKLLLTWGEKEGRMLVFYLVWVVKFTDMGAYFVGCGMGRHKLIPRISPAKTWEGVLGGALTGVLASVVFWGFSRGRLGGMEVSLSHALALGVLLAVAGIIGDLTESLFKRAAGIKDSGRIILGMGGLLDLLDSLLFAAPALYAYVRFVM